MIKKTTSCGASLLAVVFVLGLIGIAMKVLTTVGPAYYDFYTLQKVIVSVVRDKTMASEVDIRRSISDRLQINNLRDVVMADFDIQKTDNDLTITIDYEVRKNFAGNLDVVMHFKDSIGRERANASD